MLFFQINTFMTWQGELDTAVLKQKTHSAVMSRILADSQNAVGSSIFYREELQQVSLL